jgi:Raf kinase inhibitor-like YbhB/YbcL family protein
MRPAFTLLGIMTFVVFVGAFIVLSRKAEAPLLVESIIETPMSLSLTSSAFEEGERIPSLYTCDGDNINPELTIAHIPEGTKSLVLVMDDPDIPESVKQSRGIEKFNHWVLYNIPPDTTTIPAGGIVGSLGMNSRDEAKYAGREHRYIFRLYAVSGTLNFIQTPTLDQVEEATRGMIVEQATLIGKYERVNAPE